MRTWMYELFRYLSKQQQQQRLECIAGDEGSKEKIAELSLIGVDQQ